MRLWVEVARRGYLRHATYRGATIGGLFTNTVFGFMRTYILLAVLRDAGEIGGYDARDAITYVWLTQGLGAAFDMWGRWDLLERVKSGDVVTDLTRPVDFQGWWLAQDLGRFCFRLVFRGAIPVAIGAGVYGIDTPGADAGLWAAFAVSLLLAEVLSFAAAFAVGMTGFWLVDANGVQLVYGLSCSFLSGFILPLAIFPEWARGLALVLPFASMLQVPIDVFIGELSGGRLAAALTVQLAWTGVALLAGRAVVRAAMRKLVIQGG